MLEKLKASLGFSAGGASRETVAATEPPRPVSGLGTSLPPQSTPKVPKSAQALASFLRSAKASSSPLVQTDRRLANTDLTTFRNGASTSDVLRNFAAASPDLSAAIFAYLRTSITTGYTATAQNPDGSFNREATNLLQQIISRMDKLPNYINGFGGSYSLQSVAESLGKELLLGGACCAELVLDKARLPWRIQPLHTGHIEFIPDGNDLKPRQSVAGVKIELDIPTFFYVSLDQDLLTAYASSPLESALKPTLFGEDFVQDLWRVLKRAIHPRQHVKILWDKLAKQMPPEAQHDNDALTTWMNTVVADITTTVNSLGVDEALVYFDFLEIDRESNGNTSVAQEWSTLQDIVNARMATGSKTLPAILGHGVGSSNVASTESMLFVKSATGAVQLKLNEIFSRLFTLAVRLFGFDVVVTFRYDPVDLRPENELETFKAVKQSRILQQLSLGLITDEEAGLVLTGKLPPAGYVNKSGTMFTVSNLSAVGQGGGDAATPTNDGSTLNKNLAPGTPPNGGRGSNSTPGTKTGKSADVVQLIKD